MNTAKIIDCDRKGFSKIVNFRLSHQFMNIGIAIILLSIAMMFVRAFAMEGELEWLKQLLQKTLLVGMLIMSLSKDKVEDEMTISLRAQSYAIAFIVGVIYALVMPYVEFGVSNIVHAHITQTMPVISAQTMPVVSVESVPLVSVQTVPLGVCLARI